MTAATAHLFQDGCCERPGVLIQRHLPLNLHSYPGDSYWSEHIYILCLGINNISAQLLRYKSLNRLQHSQSTQGACSVTFILPQFIMRPRFAYGQGPGRGAYCAPRDIGDGPTMHGMSLQVQWKRYCLLESANPIKRGTASIYYATCVAYGQGAGTRCKCVHRET